MRRFIKKSCHMIFMVILNFKPYQTRRSVDGDVVVVDDESVGRTDGVTLQVLVELAHGLFINHI